MFTALRRQGVPSEMLVFPDEGHWVLKALNSKVWHEQVFAWMKRWLEGAPGTQSGGSKPALQEMIGAGATICVTCRAGL